MRLMQNVMNLNKDEDVVTLAMQDVTASTRPTHDDTGNDGQPTSLKFYFLFLTNHSRC